MNISNYENSFVLYYGLEGYGITSSYLIINIISLVLAVISAIFNGVITHILLGSDFAEDVSCVLISHQALSDFLSSILLLYNVIYNLIDYNAGYECAVRFGFVNGVLMTSLIIIMALTFERYIKIILPYKYLTIITPKRSKVFLISSWIFSICVCQTPLLGWNRLTAASGCRYFGVFTNNFLRFYCCFMFTLSVFVILMYGHILYIAYQQRNNINNLNQINLNQRNKPMWWRPTKTALIIVGINVICWFPSGIYVFLTTTKSMKRLSLEEKGTILTYVSSTIYLTCIANPLIYSYKIEKVRRIIRNMIGLQGKKTCITEYTKQSEKQTGL